MFKCDNCGKEFERTSHEAKRAIDRIVQHCSRACVNNSRKKGGAIFEKTSNTNVERYGVQNIGKIPGVAEKNKKAWLEKYGVDHPFKLSFFVQKREQTCLEKYGHKIASCSEVVKQKLANTFMERFGGLGPMCSEIVRAKVDWVASMLKQHETKKLNGTYKKSRIEDRFYEVLCLKFGKDDVSRQVPMKRKWFIDFYVKSIDTFIQFDGAYWHGLNRPIEVIAECKTKRDKVIYDKMMTDRDQVVYFAENNMRLVRVSDTQFIEHESNVLDYVSL